MPILSQINVVKYYNYYNNYGNNNANTEEMKKGVKKSALKRCIINQFLFLLILSCLVCCTWLNVSTDLMLYLEYCSYNYNGLCRCKFISKNEAERSTWAVLFVFAHNYSSSLTALSLLVSEEYGGKAELKEDWSWPMFHCSHDEFKVVVFSVGGCYSNQFLVLQASCCIQSGSILYLLEATPTRLYNYWA